MKKIIAQKNFLGLLSFIFTILTIWPMFGWENMKNPLALILYYHVVWIMAIFCIFLRNKYSNKNLPSNNETESKEENI